MVSIDRLVLAGARSDSSYPLIEMNRSLPSCNRPDSLSLLGSLTVSPLWCMARGGYLVMSTIEFAEELNQPRHRFSNTGAMTAKAAEPAFVRRAVASSVLGRARALVLSGLLACATAAQADNAETSADANASDNSESSGSNAANNPVEPRLTLQYWNYYYAPSLSRLHGDAESGDARVLIPFQIA